MFMKRPEGKPVDQPEGPRGPRWEGGNGHLSGAVGGRGQGPGVLFGVNKVY